MASKKDVSDLADQVKSLQEQADATQATISTLNTSVSTLQKGLKDDVATLTARVAELAGLLSASLKSAPSSGSAVAELPGFSPPARATTAAASLPRRATSMEPGADMSLSSKIAPKDFPPSLSQLHDDPHYSSVIMYAVNMDGLCDSHSVNLMDRHQFFSRTMTGPPKTIWQQIVRRALPRFDTESPRVVWSSMLTTLFTQALGPDWQEQLLDSLVGANRLTVATCGSAYQYIISFRTACSHYEYQDRYASIPPKVLGGIFVGGLDEGTRHALRNKRMDPATNGVDELMDVAMLYAKQPSSFTSPAVSDAHFAGRSKPYRGSSPGQGSFSDNPADLVPELDENGNVIAMRRVRHNSKPAATNFPRKPNESRQASAHSALAVPFKYNPADQAPGIDPHNTPFEDLHGNSWKYADGWLFPVDPVSLPPGENAHSCYPPNLAPQPQPSYSSGAYHACAAVAGNNPWLQ